MQLLTRDSNTRRLSNFSVYLDFAAGERSDQGRLAGSHRRKSRGRDPGLPWCEREKQEQRVDEILGDDAGMVREAPERLSGLLADRLGRFAALTHGCKRHRGLAEASSDGDDGSRASSAKLQELNRRLEPGNMDAGSCARRLTLAHVRGHRCTRGNDLDALELFPVDESERLPCRVVSGRKPSRDLTAAAGSESGPLERQAHIDAELPKKIVKRRAYDFERLASRRMGTAGKKQDRLTPRVRKRHERRTQQR